MSLVLDAEALYAELRQGLEQLLSHYPASQTPHLVGVASGGVWLAERLQQDLGLPGRVGVLSSSMHRDDFAQRGLASNAQTKLPFDVNGAHLIVLVDRGGRELPVAADIAVARVSLPADESLALARDAQGRFSLDVQKGKG